MHASKVANHFNPAQFSSCSFGGTVPLLQNASPLPLDHDFSFHKVKKEAHNLLEQEVRRLDGGLTSDLNSLKGNDEEQK